MKVKYTQQIKAVGIVIFAVVVFSVVCKIETNGWSKSMRTVEGDLEYGWSKSMRAVKGDFEKM